MFNEACFIKFVEEQIRRLYGNPVRVVSDGDRKFNNSAVRDFPTSAGIHSTITSAYNLRGNAKVERMIGTLKRAVQNVTASKMDQDWDMCLGKILRGYRRRPGTDGKSLFEKCLELSLGSHLKPLITGPLQPTVSLFVDLK